MNPLDRFYFYKYRVTLRPKGGLSLPPYKGSVLRGLFGHALRKVICPRKGASCDECMVRHGCAYSLLMTTPIPEDHPYAKKYRNPPHPYVIEPPLTRRRYFGPDDVLFFDVVLVGVAGECLPYVVAAFVEMGQSNRERGTFEVLAVDALDLEGRRLAQVFREGDRFTKPSGRKIEYQVFLAESAEGDTITLILETPLRIKESDRLSLDVPFHLLIRRLSERAYLLSHFYCGADLGDFEEFVPSAEGVQTLGSQVQWVDWERYSSRQKTRMRFGGFVGSITYRGEIKKYLPLLRLGEHIHVGKATTFGLGKYRMITTG